MANITVKTTNWIKGLALFGLMVAMAGMLAGAPGASAASAPRFGFSPVPASDLGKISLVAVNADPTSESDGIAGATVLVRPIGSDVVVVKGTTDASGRFASYIAAGTYEVTVTADGYKPTMQTVKVSSGQGTSLVAALEEDSVSPPASH